MQTPQALCTWAMPGAQLLGDSLASVTKMAGYDVEKEFYINDAGNQIEKVWSIFRSAIS